MISGMAMPTRSFVPTSNAPLGVVIGAGVLGGVQPLIAEGGTNRWPIAIAGGLIGVFVGLIVVSVWIGSRLYRLERDIPIAPEAVQIHAARWFGGPHWTPARQQPGELVYWRRVEPNVLTAILLLAIGLLPGLLDILSSRGTQTIAIGITHPPSGAHLDISVQPQGNDGRRTVNRFFNSLYDV